MKKNTFFLTALLAVTLAFGLAFVGCDTGNNTDNNTGGRTKVSKIPAGDTNKITIAGLDDYKGKYAYASVTLKAHAESADGPFRDGEAASGDPRYQQKLWAVQDAWSYSDSPADYITCGLIGEDGRVELKVYLEISEKYHLWKQIYTFKTGGSGVGEDFDLYIFDDETVQDSVTPIAERWFHVTAFLGGGEWTGTSNN